jgi:hypothetical protein
MFKYFIRANVRKIKGLGQLIAAYFSDFFEQFSAENN